MTIVCPHCRDVYEQEQANPGISLCWGCRRFSMICVDGETRPLTNSEAGEVLDIEPIVQLTIAMVAYQSMSEGEQRMFRRAAAADLN